MDKKKESFNFHKIQAQQNKQIIGFAESYFYEREFGKNDSQKKVFGYLKLLLHSGITPKKTLRVLLFRSVQVGDFKTALFFVSLLERKLNYSELAKLAKESDNYLEFCEDHFSERIGEIAARGTQKASDIAIKPGFTQTDIDISTKRNYMKGDTVFIKNKL